jgi:hypothetical protein
MGQNGRGIVATRNYAAKEPTVEYPSELVSKQEGVSKRGRILKPQEHKLLFLLLLLSGKRLLH